MLRRGEAGLKVNRSVLCGSVETCSPDRCRCGRAGRGSQTFGHYCRFDGCKCSCHKQHNRSLRKRTRQSTEAHLHSNRAQTHSALPVILVGCRHSVEGQRVCEHKVSPFTQVQLEQGPSGCQLEPSSYSTPSNTHTAMREEELYIH